MLHIVLVWLFFLSFFQTNKKKILVLPNLIEEFGQDFVSDSLVEVPDVERPGPALRSQSHRRSGKGTVSVAIDTNKAESGRS